MQTATESIQLQLQLLQLQLQLSAQRALLGVVTPNLRAVSLQRRADAVHWLAVFAEEPTEQERILISVAASEVVADFSDALQLVDEVLVAPPPEEVQHLEHLVYARHE